jgi:hypothetical protein
MNGDYNGYYGTSKIIDRTREQIADKIIEG